MGNVGTPTNLSYTSPIGFLHYDHCYYFRFNVPDDWSPCVAMKQIVVQRIKPVEP